MKHNVARLAVSSLCFMLGFHSSSALACAVCFGQSDSALAKGLHWGVLSLLAVVLCVLGGIASFFIYVAKRSATLPEAAPAEPLTAIKDLP